MNRPRNEWTLGQENLAFAGTKGVSKNNRKLRFRPAFRDDDTGRVEVARFENGKPAPIHLIVGLPQEWAVAFTADGAIQAIKDSIASGFVRDGTFFTREEAAAAV